MSVARGGRARRPRSMQGTLGSIVLGTELVIVLLGTLVVYGLRALPAAAAFGGGGALLVLVLAALGTSRSRIGIVLGWAVQAVLVLTVLVQILVGVVGIVFALFWVYCMIVGGRIDRRDAMS